MVNSNRTQEDCVCDLSLGCLEILRGGEREGGLSTESGSRFRIMLVLWLQL